MANPEHLEILKQGVEVWNDWRESNPQIIPRLSGADLKNGRFDRINLRKADLFESDLLMANLRNADLREANCGRARFVAAKMDGADLGGGIFSRAVFSESTLVGATLDLAKFYGANLNSARITKASLCGANLSKANLTDAWLNNSKLIKSSLRAADLNGTNFSGADLTEADLSKAVFVESNFENASLVGCRVYGVSAWRLKLKGAIQSNLIVTPGNESTITVDNLEVAQFIYLLVNNEKIRDVIDTITTKVVLILGRFTPERKAILDAIRDELRKHNYLPVLFDFDGPVSRNVRETVRTLAHLSRFIIADITDPSSIPLELETVVPQLRVPVQPLLASGYREFSMFTDLRSTYHWVLPTHEYRDRGDLLASIVDKVIVPAEAKAKELEKR